ncbi:thiopeptide-type bacteriocin biosynthesis protein [Micromonospora sp. Llam0]|uniref:thiopeptide-type bacteriocin biosynthesis protein n=1 Tax=Micromonospora sp. Llam0 TaxID=2485143 RepID=UPI000F4A9A1D|nr:thiopeptide-type bacteriocin biosynthesis protein [Micromonospora sp. Llam0]ROO52899.1 thiopeptide-type bacteriocin biosynthesis protein [Micromonospora sp. Llam0]
MNPTPWLQVTIEPPDPAQTEHLAVTHLMPLLTEAETDKLITAWFFIRKTPRWRLRYLPAHQPARTRSHVLDHLDSLTRDEHIRHAVDGVYEPETRAFGGVEAMAVAHRLWHADSRHVLTYLAATAEHPTDRRRRELAMILSTALLRAAGLDWYEQGDVWVRVADHRPSPADLGLHDAAAIHSALRRLMSINLTTTAVPDGPSATASDWAGAFATAGHDLAHLATTGHLHRGLRDVLAHHIIFAMNRLGLPATTQAVLATHAADTVFGPDPAARPEKRSPEQAATTKPNIATGPGTAK